MVATPEAYRDYLRASRAEILCPKPIFREMNTGWFSDRSVCYMALGQPVLAEETGFGDFVPTGHGVLDFRDMDEAVAISSRNRRQLRICTAAGRASWRSICSIPIASSRAMLAAC